jgi:hypothetical protein
MSFMTYKLFLTNIAAVFGGVRMPWNKNYDKVRMCVGALAHMHVFWCVSRL